MRKGFLVEIWGVRINLNANLICFGLQNDVLDLFNMKFHQNAILCHFVVLTRKVRFDRNYGLWLKNIIFVQICCQMSTEFVLFSRLQPLGNVFAHFWKNKILSFFTFLNTPPLGPPGFYNVNPEGKNTKFASKNFEIFSNANFKNPTR